MTNAEERKKFKLTTLALCANNDERVMVNLCDPISEPHKNHGKELSKKGARHHRLTPRQTEVLKLLSKGKTGTDIAANMGISVFTVSNHTQQVRLKLNAKTGIEAVAIGHKLGLI